MKYLRDSKIQQIEIADDFCEAYERCFRPYQGRISAIPGFVNGLFAAELYLKLLVGDKAKTLKGKERHSLFLLYKLLEGDEKSSLESVMSDNRYKLEELLRNIADGFVVWRYFYEDGNENFGDGHPFEYTEVFLSSCLPKLSEMARKKVTAYSGRRSR